MTSSFAIQASQPRTEASYDPDDESLCDAVQSTFPLRTESMLIVWNGVYIPLGYKCDVSFIVDDGLDLLDAMLTSATGRRTIHWPSNTFASSWVVEWDPSNVVIEATWRAVVGGTEACSRQVARLPSRSTRSRPSGRGLSRSSTPPFGPQAIRSSSFLDSRYSPASRNESPRMGNCTSAGLLPKPA